MIPAPLQSALGWCKASLWQVACGVLALLGVIFFALYFLQGGMLAERALENGQRLLIPLKEDGEWIGKQITIEVPQENTAENPTQEPVAAETLPSPPMVEPAPAIAASASPSAEAPSEMVVGEALTEQINAASETATAAASTPEAETTESTPVNAATAPIAAPTPRPAGKALAAAPDNLLNIKEGEFLLPRIAEDGTKPWQFFAKPFQDDKKKPIVAIIIRGLGLGRLTTESALNLDSHFTLSFSPYSANTQMWGGHARNTGHEVLLDLPQEGTDYPAIDPGPYALLNTLDSETNKNRLKWVMSRVPGYVGFLQTEKPALPSGAVLGAFSEIAKRGVLLIKTPQGNEASAKQEQQMGLVSYPYTRQIDEVLSDEAIREQLNLLVKDAKAHGRAIAVARPYPLTIKMLDEFTDQLAAHGVVLAPVSAVVARDY